MPLKQRDRNTGEETGDTLTLFKAVSVFDAQQVDPLPSGQPTPLEPPSQPLTGDSHPHLIAPALAFAERPLGQDDVQCPGHPALDL